MSALLSASVLTEHAGTGRVLSVRFFRGAGYCIRLVRGKGWDGHSRGPRWPNIALRGFTVYVRVAPTRLASTWGRGFGRVAITTNGNAYNPFK